MDSRRLARHLRRWDALPADKRVNDAQLAREYFVPPSQAACVPAPELRCLAASQGDTAIHYALVRYGRYFRCRRRRTSWSEFCRLHLTIASRRALTNGRRRET